MPTISLSFYATYDWSPACHLVRRAMENEVANTRPTNGNQKSKTGKLMLAIALLLAARVLAQNIPTVSPVPARTKRQVLVSIPDRKLALVYNSTVLMAFPVAADA